MNKNALSFVEACERIFGNNAVVTRDGIAEVVSESGAPYPYWLVTKSEFRHGRGYYKVPSSGKTITKKESIKHYSSMYNIVDTAKIIPRNFQKPIIAICH